MEDTTRIATGAITTDITTAGTTISTGVGLPACMVTLPFLGIIAIGKQSYFTVGPPHHSLKSLLCSGNAKGERDCVDRPFHGVANVEASVNVPAAYHYLQKERGGAS